MCCRHCDDPFCEALDEDEYDLRGWFTRAIDLLHRVDIDRVREELDPADYRQGRLLVACEVLTTLASYDTSLPEAQVLGSYQEPFYL